MNVGTQMRRFVRINLMSHLRLTQIGSEGIRRTASTSTPCGRVKCVPQPHVFFNSGLDRNDLCRMDSSVCSTQLFGLDWKGSVSDPQRKRSISDPRVTSNMNIGLPITPLSIIRDFDLPTVRRTEMIDPVVGVVIKKEAFKLRRIRRRKMKKHKHKKVMKKLKFFYEKLKMRRKSKKEAVFQGALNEIIKDGLNYSPEEQHKQNLELLNWKQPVNRVRGSFSPKWFVDEYLEELKKRKQVDERVEYCLKRQPGQ